MPNPIDNRSDQLLIESYLGGERDAGDILYAQHRQSLFRSVRRLLREKACDAHLVEDIVQSVWGMMFENDGDALRRYQEQQGTLNTYLASIAKRVLLLRHRQAMQRRHRGENGRRVREVPLEGHDPADPGADTAVVQAELVEYVQSLTRQELRCLREKQMGDPEPALKPPLAGGNARFLRHCLQRKWKAHFEVPREG